MTEWDSETSRIRAVLVNSGKYSFPEADRKLAASNLTISLGEEAAKSPAGQAAFLTAVLTGVKTFGQVILQGALGMPMLFPLPIPGTTLGEVGVALGAACGENPLPTWRILVGPGQAQSDWSVQAYWDGWIAGVSPGGKPVAMGRSDCALAGIAAGALAVGEAFLAETGAALAGKNFQRLSLWEPDAGEQDGSGPGPHMDHVFLPLDLWLVGLGNLGQAYLWSLFHLPYPNPGEVRLVLQDADRVRKENWGTSVLVRKDRYGMLKTSLAEEWAAALGFQAYRIDRMLGQDLLVRPDEPRVALAGLHDMPTRKLLGERGFEYVIDGGLGATFDEYRKFRVNTFNGPFSPAGHFQELPDRSAERIQQNLQLEAYRQLAASGGEAICGTTTLAGISAAVPFVGTFTGALVVAQAIRIASGEAHHISITGEVGALSNTRGNLGEPPVRPTVRYSPAHCDGWPARGR